MKRDKARVYTDRKLNELEKELSRVYARALDETQKAWGEFTAAFEDRAKQYLDEIEKHKLSGDRTMLEKSRKEYKKFLRENTLQNQHYQRVVDKLSNDFAHIDQAAYRLVNNLLPDIYAVNYNGIVDKLPVGYSFHLVDAQTVTNLITKDINLLKDARWNRQRFNSEILQGILQGESIPKIAKRLEQFVGGNEAAAVRNARTAVTYAENQGRLDSMKEAHDEGIILAKEWIATEDSRTRDSHRKIDGDVVGIDDKFDNELECPGDPSGDAAEIYNCRCSLGEIVIGFRRDDGSIEYTAEGEQYRGRFD